MTGLRGVRFRRVVRPGEAVAVRLAAGAEGEARFEVWAGEERVSDGAARVEETRAASPQLVPQESPLSPEIFPAIAELIPHRPPALLLRQLLSREGGGLVALAAVPCDSPFAARDRVPAFLAVEMAAQAAAALEGLGREEGSPGLGYLVGIRQAVFPHPWLPVETPLRVEVRPAGGAPPLALYDLDVAASETLFATGSLSAYLA